MEEMDVEMKWPLPDLPGVPAQVPRWARLVMHLRETSPVWPTVGCSEDCGSVGWQPY